MSKPIRLAATGVAEFVSSTPAQRRRILRPYKKRQSGEARGRGHYYRVALNAIRHFFNGKKDVGIITDALQALELRKKGPFKKRGEPAEIKHNIRVLKAFLHYYAGRDFVVVPGQKIECTIGRVEVTCNPDLWAEENAKLLLVKFFFQEKKPKTLQIPVLLHLLREAAHHAGMNPTVICLDMDGVEHKCPADRHKMQALVAPLEKELEATWNSI
jgi:hypothetical protein